MKHWSKILFSSVIVPCCAVAGEMRSLTLQTAVPAKTPPVIDGSLTDACWRDAPVHDKYYVYLNTAGEVAPMKTTSRLLYGKDGIYLGIENFCSDPQKIRRTITTNSHGEIWTDDCAEIYFNAASDDVSYRRFAVNANSALHTMSRDATLLLNKDFMAPGTKFQCTTGKDRWIIEAFFPWEDLGGHAAAGSLWTFCHVRYAWPDGKFYGMSSSVHGSVYHPQDFGWLYFAADNRPPRAAEFGKIITGKVRPPWGFEQGGMLVSDEGNGMKIEPLTEKLAAGKTRYDSLLSSLRGVFQAGSAGAKQLEAVEQEHRKAAGLARSNPVAYLIGWNGRIQKLEELHWLSKLEQKYSR